MVKKNVPYKVLKGLWIALVALVVLNIVSLWLAWYNIALPFGIVIGVFTLLDLIAMSVIAFLNANKDIRLHGFTYALLAVIHLVFVIVLFTTFDNNVNRACPALFTVFLVVILVICAYFALKGKHPLQAFGIKKEHKDDQPIRREDLGSNPTEEKVHQVAAEEENKPKHGRDEKTGIVSL